MKEKNNLVERINRICTARHAILEDLKNRYKSGDKTVIPAKEKPFNPYYDEPEPEQENYFAGQGMIKCPLCGSGNLRYRRASVNLHVHAHCDTRNCVSWME